MLGKVEVKSENSQFLLKRSLLNSMTYPGGAACFSPRHGLRITDGEKTLDLVICFECGNIVTYYGDQKGEAEIGDLSNSSVYNQILKNSGIEPNQ